VFHHSEEDFVMDRLRRLLAVMSLAALLAVPPLTLGAVPAETKGPARGECLFLFLQEPGTLFVQVHNKKGESYSYTTDRPPKNCQSI